MARTFYDPEFPGREKERPQEINHFSVEVRTMKKGICYGSLPGKTAEEKCRLAAEAGFDGVELPTIDSPEETAAVLRTVRRFGLEVSSIMCSAHWAHPLSHPDAAEREICRANIRRSIDEAVEVGADTVLVVPGVVNEGVMYEQAWERSMAELKELAPYAEEKKVYIAIENVWNKFLLSPMEFVRFIDEIGSPWVQAYFDVGNILLYGFPQHWIRSLGSRIKKVHVKGFKRQNFSWVYLLEGDVPWNAVMEAFKEIGYNDYITAEVPAYPMNPSQMPRDVARHLDWIFGL